MIEQNNKVLFTKFTPGDLVKSLDHYDLSFVIRYVVAGKNNEYVYICELASGASSKLHYFTGDEIEEIFIESDIDRNLEKNDMFSDVMDIMDEVEYGL